MHDNFWYHYEFVHNLDFCRSSSPLFTQPIATAKSNFMPLQKLNDMRQPIKGDTLSQIKRTIKLKGIDFCITDYI